VKSGSVMTASVIGGNNRRGVAMALIMWHLIINIALSVTYCGALSM